MNQKFGFRVGDRVEVLDPKVWDAHITDQFQYASKHGVVTCLRSAMNHCIFVKLDGQKKSHQFAHDWFKHEVNKPRDHHAADAFLAGVNTKWLKQ